MADCNSCRSWQKTDPGIGWCMLLRKFTIDRVQHNGDCHYTPRNESIEKLERAIVRDLHRRIKQARELNEVIIAPNC